MAVPLMALAMFGFFYERRAIERGPGSHRTGRLGGRKPSRPCIARYLHHLLGRFVDHHHRQGRPGPGGSSVEDPLVVREITQVEDQAGCR